MINKNGTMHIYIYIYIYVKLSLSCHQIFVHFIFEFSFSYACLFFCKNAYFVADVLLGTDFKEHKRL